MNATLTETMTTSKPLTDWEATRNDFENLPIGTIALVRQDGRIIKVERVETHRVAWYTVNAQKLDGRKGFTKINGSQLVEVISRPGGAS